MRNLSLDRTAICHSLRGSVDWNKKSFHIATNNRVTPYAGVWIEIIYAVGMTYSCVTSLPTRECGLKSLSYVPTCTSWQVTPYAGVWIEISWSRNALSNSRSLPTRECGLKYKLPWRDKRNISHSLRGSVDWNCLVIVFRDWEASHSLRGSVDWNKNKVPQDPEFFVTPYAGVWIEITCSGIPNLVVVVTPYAGVWIEISLYALQYIPVQVTPYAGVWIEISVMQEYNINKSASLPTRECGLKLYMIAK